MQTTVDLVSTDNVFHNTMEMRIKLEFSRGEHVFLRHLGLRCAHAACRGAADTMGALCFWGGPFSLVLGDTPADRFFLVKHPEMG